MKTDKLKYAKRVWFFTDPHIGVRNSAVEWMDSVESYFKEVMLPTMRHNYRPGDICACLGDVFDSRNSINIRALNIGHWLFTELSSIFQDTVVILGNHDVFNKSSNDINSVKFMASEKVHVFEEPASIMVGEKRVLLMPWRIDHAAEKALLHEAGSHDMLWCHADIRGATFNKRTVIEDGCGEEEFVKFERVYTGHIHHRQDKGNVKILGTPYQLTRSDAGNPKGITLLDLSDMSETFFENTHSPRFVAMTLEKLLQLTKSEFAALTKNNYCDLYVTLAEMESLSLPRLHEHTGQSRSFSVWPDVNQSVSSAPAITLDGADQLSVESLITEYAQLRVDLPEARRELMLKSLLMIKKQAEEQMEK